MAKSGIIWYKRTLFIRLPQLPLRFNEEFQAFMEQWAERFERYAQENAPWEDRTGDARSGLTAITQAAGFGERIVLRHSVDYGLYLEVRWSGRYAIIVPTIETLGPELMSEFRGMFGRMR